jgi:hypothetical protein
MIKEVLNILAVIGGHTLLHGPLQLAEDEISSIKPPQIIRIAIVHQVDMVMATPSYITEHSCNVLPEQLGQCVVVVIHVSNPMRVLFRIRSIAEGNLLNVHGLLEWSL